MQVWECDYGCMSTHVQRQLYYLPFSMLSLIQSRDYSKECEKRHLFVLATANNSTNHALFNANTACTCNVKIINQCMNPLIIS